MKRNKTHIKITDWTHVRNFVIKDELFECIEGKNRHRWNRMRRSIIDRRINLTEIDLSGLSIDGFNLSNCNLDSVSFYNSSLSGANLKGSILNDANFNRSFSSGAIFAECSLKGTLFKGADLIGAKFKLAKLKEADFSGANLTDAFFDKANLSYVDFSSAILVNTSFKGSTLRNVDVEHAAIYDIIIDKSTQQRGIQGNSYFKRQRGYFFASRMNPGDIRAASFLSMITNPANLKYLIDEANNKMVLILGRFDKRRTKLFLKLNDYLFYQYGIIPVTFSFEKPAKRDLIETIMMLAGFSRFIIADITDPRSTPLELQAITPYIKLPIIPIRENNRESFSLFDSLQQKYFWCSKTIRYDFNTFNEEFMQKLIIRAQTLEKRIAMIQV